MLRIPSAVLMTTLYTFFPSFALLALPEDVNLFPSLKKTARLNKHARNVPSTEERTGPLFFL